MTPMEKWKQEAEIKGLQKGLHEGRRESRFEIIRTMLSKGLEPAFIAQNTGISMDEITILEKEPIA